MAQSGFRALHSCETALIRLVDIWTSNIEKGLLNGIVLLDLRKAFDLVDTEVLLHKLEMYQCDKNTLNWFRSYLQGRTQCVPLKAKYLKKNKVTHGAPQGSILGPLLFTIFMNDILLHVRSPLDMYADDFTLHSSAATIEDLTQKLNYGMFQIQKWCQNNKMVVNIDKTKVMLITTHQKESKLQKTQLDKHLTWKDHIDKTGKPLANTLPF